MWFGKYEDDEPELSEQDKLHEKDDFSMTAHYGRHDEDDPVTPLSNEEILQLRKILKNKGF